jgi:hypothetical protein
LFREVPNYDIQIGVRHFYVSSSAIMTFRMSKYATAEEALQIARLANAPVAAASTFGAAG